MWIRTQNKYILANVNSFRICKGDIDGDVYYSIHGHYDGHEQSLGYYSTKEKAINVLYEIQEKINYEHSYTIDLMDDKVYLLNEDVNVYQMPQDDEV